MRYNHYEYLVMSFGASNAPGVFMEYINKVFHSYLDKFLVLFIMIFLIYSKTDEEHAKHPRVMLKLLQEKQLYVMLSKSEFWLREVIFLGDVICSGGIIIDPSKVEDVLQ